MPNVDFFNLAVVIFPLTFYFGFLALAHRSALCLTAQIDFGLLGAGLAGLVFVGPLQLFVPLSSLAMRGGVVWLMVLAIYWLLALFIGGMLAKRMIVYGISPEEARRLLAEAAKRYTPQAEVRDDILFITDSEGHSRGHIEMRTSKVGRCASLTLCHKQATSEDVANFQKKISEVFRGVTKDTSRWGKIWFPLFSLGFLAEVYLFSFHGRQIVETLMLYIHG